MEIKGFKDTIEWYDKNSNKYAESAEKSPPTEMIIEFMSKLPKSPSILDAGCGSGRDSRLLKKEGAKVVGIDISKGLLNEARKRSSEIEYMIGDITAIPFSNNTFDGVWSHASLVHLEKIEDAEKAIHEFNRVLRTDGILHIFTKKQEGDNKTDVVSDSLSNHDRFFRYYTESELRNLVETAGFTDIDIKLAPDPHGRKEVTWILLHAKKAIDKLFLNNSYTNS